VAAVPVSESPLEPATTLALSEDMKQARDDNGDSWTLDTLHEHLVSMIEASDRLMVERDRMYDMRFRTAETAVNAALVAQDKQTSSSFLASEKAVLKAEEAQREYNVRSNEFRGQLDDQAKMLMPRAEVAALLKAMEEKIISVKNELETRIGGQNAAAEKSYQEVRKDIQGLREYRSQATGAIGGVQQSWGVLVAVAMFVVAVVGAAVGGLVAWLK
jgi:ATP-dependent Clp protease ATP-binding subunit ClpA